MLETKFTNWYSWTGRETSPCPGVYAIAHSARNLTGKAFTLRKEIIYFGMTNAPSGLRGRLQMFDKTIKGERLQHGGADRVRNTFRNYNKLVLVLYVAVADFPCDPKKKEPADLRIMGEVARLEYLCLAAYKERFAELPRFNDPTAVKFSKHQPKSEPPIRLR